MTLVGAFGDEYDAWKSDRSESVDDPRPKYLPRFLELAEHGDPDAKRWILDFTDYEGAATDSKLIETLFRYLDELLRDHGDGWRAEVLPMGEIWWYFPERRDWLLARVDRYFEKTANAKGRAAIARELADSYFSWPRGIEDQERARRFCQVVIADAEEPADREWAQRVLDVLAWQRLGNPAPDIVGKDVDGNDLALFDSRGKIAVLEFWGFW